MAAQKRPGVYEISYEETRTYGKDSNGKPSKSYVGVLKVYDGDTGKKTTNVYVEADQVENNVSVMSGRGNGRRN